MARSDRKESRAAHSEPLNYTCGLCRQVHKFNSEKPYVCEDIVEEVS